VSPEPVVSRQTVREAAKPAEMLWEASVRAFDPYPDRLRTLAEAAGGQARVIQLAELADMPWRPREGARQISLADGLEETGGRQGPPELWEEFDSRLRALGVAMESDRIRAVWTAFEGLRDITIEIADAIQPPVEETSLTDGEAPQEQAG
jgi:hypothetical protein